MSLSFRALNRWLVPFPLLLSLCVAAEQTSDPVNSSQRTFVDESRSIEAAFEFPGTPERRVDVTVWFPDASVDGAGSTGGAPWPLIVYSHGTYGYPANAMHFVDHLVRNGYIVAAPTFPLTSRESFTGIPMAAAKDVANQPADVSFVVDQLLQDDKFGPLIDAGKIGVAGHSLGAVTGYFLTYGAQIRDPRIGANAMLGGGDPVQAVLSSDLGFDGVMHAPVPVPSLFLSAEHDVFANLTGRPFAAYSRVEPPKHEVFIRGGNHIWFRDGKEKHPDGKNPDCLFFELNAPGMQVPGCQAPVKLVDPDVQKEITRSALLNFFDAYLKGDASALAELRRTGDQFPAAEIRSEG